MALVAAAAAATAMGSYVVVRNYYRSPKIEHFDMKNYCGIVYAQPEFDMLQYCGVAFDRSYTGKRWPTVQPVIPSSNTTRKLQGRHDLDKLHEELTRVLSSEDDEESDYSFDFDELYNTLLY